MYTYKALVRKVYDGDTITVDIDLGLNVWLKGQKIRLYGLDAPEIRGEERPTGLISKKHLSNLILGKTIKLRTIRDSKGKYGRWLGIVCLGSVNVNQWLIERGYAVQKYY